MSTAATAATHDPTAAHANPLRARMGLAREKRQRCPLIVSDMVKSEWQIGQTRGISIVSRLMRSPSHDVRFVSTTL